MANPFLNYYAGNMAPPVQGPNGTLVPVPNYLTPEQIYAGILPPSLPSRSDPTGAGPGSFAQMQGLVGDPIYGGGGNQPNSGTIRTAGTAGTVGLPPGVTPASVLRAFEQMQGVSGQANKRPPVTALAAINNAAPPAPRVGWGNGVGYGYADKDETRLGSAAGLPSLFEPAPQQQGRVAPIPRRLPTVPTRAPIPPASIPLTQFTPPTPRARPNQPQQNGFLTLLGNAFNATPAGHIVQAVQGKPITGGLLGMLLNNRQPGGQPVPLPPGPARTNPNITYNYPLATPGDNRPQILGTDMAFMPQSVQKSSRWNTGY